MTLYELKELVDKAVLEGYGTANLRQDIKDIEISLGKFLEPVAVIIFNKQESNIKKSPFKVGDKVWYVEQELGGVEFVNCTITESHLGIIDDDEPYPYEEYDIKSSDGRIWEFVNIDDVYKTKKEAKEHY